MYYTDNHLFDEVYTGPLVIGEKIILSHEPLPNIDWALNLHGHNHNGGKTDIYHYNCYYYLHYYLKKAQKKIFHFLI